MRKYKLFAAALLVVLFVTPVFSQVDIPGQKKLPAKPANAAEFTEKSVSEAESAESADLEAFRPKPIDTTTAPTVIAFGSCNKLDKPQSMWQFVSANNPNLWIWLGDIIYADTTDTKALAAHYRRLKTNPDYKKLRTKAQVVGVYDDHDYGVNDACKYHPTKRGAKKCLMDFLDIPLNNPVRKRDGAYQSYTFGKGNQKIKVIVMDLRYFRDSLVPDVTKQKRYVPNQLGDMLGENQWVWLEKELRNSQANLNILCSSVQVIADDHGYEKWGNFPNERKRLLKLITSVKPKNLMILSGDRHMAEISKMQIEGLPYPLYDFTSSGMTHIRSGTSEVNRFRVGQMIVQKNFGLLKIRWEGEKPIVTMEARGLQNELFLSETVRY